MPDSARRVGFVYRHVVVRKQSCHGVLLTIPIKRILIPLDGRGIAEEILPIAAYLARRLKATLLLTVVVDIESARYDGALVGSRIPGADIDQLVEQEVELSEQRAKRIVQGLITDLRRQGVHVRSVIAHGDPYDQIVEIVNRENVGLIAITTRGRTGLARTFGGSLADRLIRESGVPVLVTSGASLDE